MSTIVVRPFHAPFGELLLGSLDGALCLCDWRYRRMRRSVDARIARGTGARYEEGSSPVIEEAAAQLTSYFAGGRKAFDLPLHPVGTAFQQRVWKALAEVPFGETRTYAQLTAQVAEPAAIRAVAAANGANALSIIVPCHRIIGASGELVGYAGGLAAKRRLLELEGATAGKPQVDLFSAVGGI
jgi:methylated-DNA-[protein]-cysteine S-methyltransferase